MDERVKRVLIESLADPNEQVRYEAATALAQQNDPSALREFTSILADTVNKNRKSAAMYLGLMIQMGNTDAIDILLAYAQDPDDGVRAAVIDALGQCIGKIRGGARRR
jgi:uncharacterized protein (DUF2336 family)